MPPHVRANDVAQFVEVAGLDEVPVVAVAPLHVLLDPVEVQGERLEQLVLEEKNSAAVAQHHARKYLDREVKVLTEYCLVSGVKWEEAASDISARPPAKVVLKNKRIGLAQCFPIVLLMWPG